MLLEYFIQYALLFTILNPRVGVLI